MLINNIIITKTLQVLYIVGNQVQSNWLPDNQGFRQGGELSSFVYLVFISDRLNEPEICSKNTGLLIKCSK